MSENKSLVARLSQKFGVDNSAQFFETLKATAFKQRDGSAPTNEQMMALLVVSEQYGLNPFTKEIYAFPDKSNGIVPVVGVDGWCRIINEHPQYDGVEFEYSDNFVEMPGAKPCPDWMECVIYRKDRSHPIRIREYLDEVYRPPFKGNGRNGPYTKDGPWQSHTKRSVRHKTLVQCSRVAFGFSGIYDQDEAERIRDMGAVEVVSSESGRYGGTGQATGDSPMLLEHKELDPLLSKLVERANAAKAWSAAYEYVKDRYTGSELAYANQFLRRSELSSVDLPKPKKEASHEPEIATNDETQARAVTKDVPNAQSEGGEATDVANPEMEGAQEQ